MYNKKKPTLIWSVQLEIMNLTQRKFIKIKQIIHISIVNIYVKKFFPAKSCNWLKMQENFFYGISKCHIFFSLKSVRFVKEWPIWDIPSQLGKCLTLTPFDLAQIFFMLSYLLKKRLHFLVFLTTQNFFNKFWEIWSLAPIWKSQNNLKNPVSINKIFGLFGKIRLAIFFDLTRFRKM